MIMRLIPAALVFLIAGATASFAEDAATSCPAPGKSAAPAMPTHTLPPYPPLSVRSHEQGQVLFTVTILRDGTPGEISLLQSSGSSRLDNAATSFVKERWRWQPLPADCNMASTQLKVFVSWHVFDGFPPKFDTSVTIAPSQYPASAMERHEDGDTYLLLILDDGGKVMDGRVVFSSGYPDLDEKALAVMKDTGAMAGFPAGRQIVKATWMPPLKNMEAVVITATRIQQRY